MNDPKIVKSESTEENKAVERLIDNQLDEWQEDRLREVPYITEGLGE